MATTGMGGSERLELSVGTKSRQSSRREPRAQVANVAGGGTVVPRSVAS